MEKEFKGILIAVVVVALLLSPFGIMVLNSHDYAVHKVNDATSYKTKKEVEDTCRSYIVSYKADKMMYEQYKDSDNKEEKKWAANAKIRANKTAITYNEYILKNSYVFDGNVPADISEQLEIIE